MKACMISRLQCNIKDFKMTNDVQNLSNIEKVQMNFTADFSTKF